MAHKIGAEFHLPHGRINAILLPYVVRYNSSEPTKFVSFPKYEYYIADEKYYTMAKKVELKADTKEEGINSLIEKIKELNEHLNIPKSFKDAGIDEQEFLAKVDMLADRAFEDQCTTANPRVPLVQEIKQILLDSYYGNWWLENNYNFGVAKRRFENPHRTKSTIPVFLLVCLAKISN